MEEKITITVKEYKELIKLATRAKVFAEFAKKEDYCITVAQCAAFFGFDVVEKPKEKNVKKPAEEAAEDTKEEVEENGQP